jgi:hypothetical protein
VSGKPLSLETQAAVIAFRSDPASVTLAGAEQVFAAACTVNWDDHHGAPALLLRHPDCELATAVALFWRGGAGELLLDCATPECADEEFYAGAGDDVRFLVEVHAAVVSGRIAAGKLAFDPRADDGADWTQGLDPGDFAYPVDGKLFEAVGTTSSQ